MTGRALTLLGLVVALLVAVTPPASAAKRATIGSDLAGTASPNSGYSCGIVNPICAIQQTAIPGNPHKLRAPFTGRIRRWRFRNIVAPETPIPIRLRVVHPIGPNQFRFVRSSAKRVLTAAGRHRYKARIRIRKGDFIALAMNTGEENHGINGFYAPSEDALALEWFPALGNGDGGTPTSTSEGTEFFYNATIKRRRRG